MEKNEKNEDYSDDETWESWFCRGPWSRRGYGRKIHRGHRKGEEHWDGCCSGWWFGRRRFPTFAVIIFVIGAVWLLTEIGVITARIPFWPTVLLIAGLGGIIDYYSRRKRR